LYIKGGREKAYGQKGEKQWQPKRKQPLRKKQHRRRKRQKRKNSNETKKTRDLKKSRVFFYLYAFRFYFILI
jgi:hypothetical protein